MAPTLPPKCTLDLTPFTVSIPDSKVEELRVLLQTTKLASETYENTQMENHWGTSRGFMQKVIERWSNGYSWRNSEKYINSFPQFTATVKVKDEEFKMHFVGVFSEDPEAQSILLLHGWPGSYLELLDMIATIQTLSAKPINLVAPSNPGWAFSGKPPVYRNFDTTDVANIMDGLMSGLGFGIENGGYIAHGGDYGSFIARLLCAKYTNCRGMHVNAMLHKDPPETNAEELDEFDRRGFENLKYFQEKGSTYQQAHASRGATMGYMVASNPVALLAWVSQFYPPTITADALPGGLPLDKYLENLTLWWFTETYPTSIYFYRVLYSDLHTAYIEDEKKVIGYSAFRNEVLFTPKSWFKTVSSKEFDFYRRHEVGGHFAAWEQPKLLAQDILDFLG